MFGRRKTGALTTMALLVAACAQGGAAPSPGTAAPAGTPAATGATEAASAPTAAAEVPSVCSEESQDLDQTSVGPNGEASTPTTGIPDLSEDQVIEAQGAAYKWAYLPSGTSTWFSAVEAGAKDEAERLGLSLTVTADSQFDPAKQAADVESAMATDPDIILTLPVDPTQGPLVIEVNSSRTVKLMGR
jgi:ribose transport system substrate-binding protein